MNQIDQEQYMQQEQPIIKRPGWFSRNIIAPIAEMFLEFDFSINQASIAQRLAEINNENKKINNLSFPVGGGEIESAYDKLPIFSTAAKFPNNSDPNNKNKKEYKIKLFFLGYGQTIENALDTVSNDPNEFTIFVPLGYSQNSLMKYLQRHVQNGCTDISIETMSMGGEMLNKAQEQYNLAKNNNSFQQGRELFDQLKQPKKITDQLKQPKKITDQLKQQKKITIYNAPKPQGSIASNMANVMAHRRGEIIQEQGGSKLPWYQRFGKWILNKIGKKGLQSLVKYCVDKKLNEGNPKISEGFDTLLENANIQQAVTLKKGERGEVYDTMLGTNILANDPKYQKNRTLILGDHRCVSGGTLTNDQYLKLVDLGIQDTPENLNTLKIMNYYDPKLKKQYLQQLLASNINDTKLKEIVQRDMYIMNRMYNDSDQIDEKIKNLPENEQNDIELKEARNHMINAYKNIVPIANSNGITISEAYAIGMMIKEDEVKNKNHELDNTKDKIINEIHNFLPVVLQNNLNEYKSLFKISSKGINIATFQEFHRLYNTGLENKTNYLSLSGLLNNQIHRNEKLDEDTMYEKMFDVYVDKKKQEILPKNINQDEQIINYDLIDPKEKASLMKELLEKFKQSKNLEEQNQCIQTFKAKLNEEHNIYKKEQIQNFFGKKTNNLELLVQAYNNAMSNNNIKNQNKENSVYSQTKPVENKKIINAQKEVKQLHKDALKQAKQMGMSKSRSIENKMPLIKSNSKGS